MTDSEKIEYLRKALDLILDRVDVPPFIRTVARDAMDVTKKDYRESEHIGGMTSAKRVDIAKLVIAFRMKL